jgi:hypothetical protein
MNHNNNKGIKIKKVKFFDINSRNETFVPDYDIKQENLLTKKIYFCDVDIVCPENFNQQEEDIKKMNQITENVNNLNNQSSRDIMSENILRSQGGFTRLELPNFIRQKEEQENNRFDFLRHDFQQPEKIILPFPRGGEVTRQKYSKNEENLPKRENLENRKPIEILDIRY